MMAFLKLIWLAGLLQNAYAAAQSQVTASCSRGGIALIKHHIVTKSMWLILHNHHQHGDGVSSI